MKEDKLHYYALISNLAYKKGKKSREFATKLLDQELKEIIYIELSEYGFYHANLLILKKNEKKIVFSFCGTETIGDIINDLQLRNVPLLDLHMHKIKDTLPKVHKGFLVQYNVLKPYLYQTILDTNPSKIIFCGHSLGGALAEISHLCMSVFFPNIECSSYTYGSPRVGNKIYELYFNHYIKPNTSFRVYHEYDPVPKHPIYNCHPSSSVVNCIKKEGDSKIIHFLKSFFGNIKYHYLLEYTKSLEK